MCKSAVLVKCRDRSNNKRFGMMKFGYKSASSFIFLQGERLLRVKSLHPMVIVWQCLTRGSRKLDSGSLRNNPFRPVHADLGVIQCNSAILGPRFSTIPSFNSVQEENAWCPRRRPQRQSECNYSNGNQKVLVCQVLLRENSKSIQ